MNLGLYLARSACFWPDRPAIIFQDRVISFLELERRTNRLAHALLAMGLKRGDRVAIVSHNRPEIIELEGALYKAGLVKVALNARLAVAELADALANAEPIACLAGPQHQSIIEAAAADVPSLRYRIAIASPDRTQEWLDYESLLKEAAEDHIHVRMQPSELAVLHYTSGSTGKLKAARQTVGNRMAALTKVVMGRMHAQKDDVMMLSGPITHASGMFIQPMLYQGVTLLVMEHFRPPEILEAIEKHKVTICFFVPTMINALLAEPSLVSRDLSSLRLVSYGAAPMSPTRIKEAWTAFGPVLSQGYGAGETTGGVIALSIDDHRLAIEGDRAELLGSCGRPVSFSDIQILNEQGNPVQEGEIGEICVRGPDVFDGFWKAPQATSDALDQDGWLHTGDLARIDALGYIYIIDRKKDMLVSGGFNVYPNEVEAALAQHPAVYEACVVGIPDERWGESVKAVVVLRQGAIATDKELMAFCRERLAGFKQPRSVDFVDMLPKNANGKLSRKEVREPYWRGHERRVN